MNRYFKILLLLLIASATTLFICGITADQAFAAFQNEAGEEEVGYTEEEYEAWDAADKEPDILKSGTMLIEFMQKNPESKLVPYAEGSYMRLLAKCVEEKKYQELETLAEQWNAFKPGDDNILRMIAVSAKELKHTEKYLAAIEELYKREPQLNFAREIAALHKEMKNDDKYVVWTEIIMKDPEEASNFLLHYELFNHYTVKNNSAKSMEYTQSTLKAIDQLQNPSAEEAKIIPDIRHALNHNLGVAQYTEKKYDAAISYFMKALKDKKYSNGYYVIGNCLWEQKKVMNAMFAFAKAQQVGESAQASAEDKSIAPKAKDRMEQLYKAMQNNTLVGIDRRYDRARKMSDEELLQPMD